MVRNPKLRFLDQCREAIRFKHFSRRTEEAYVYWVRRFILFQGTRHPKDMGRWNSGVADSSGATEKVAVSTQNQALNSLMFM